MEKGIEVFILMGQVSLNSLYVLTSESILPETAISPSNLVQINPPSDFNPEHWSLGFIHWLNQIIMPTQAGTLSLKTLLKAYHTTREQLLEVTRQLRHEVKLHYPDLYKLLMTVPGVGPIVSMCLIAQIGDITRFKSYRHLSSYAGFIPNYF